MKKIFLLIIMLGVMVSAFAAPAYRKPFKVKQSDGTELTVVLAGDESIHYFATLDGKPLVKEPNGDYMYASFSEEGHFVSLKMLAHDSGNRSLVEEALLSSVDYEQMAASVNKAAKARSASFKAAAQKAGSQITPKGDVNVAVVLVQFKDVKFTYTKEDINNLLNTEGYKLENPFVESVGSARDYFLAQSDCKFRPNFVVTDIVTLDNNMSYYGGNDASGDDKKASYAVKEGIQKADATFDFSKCDNNGDGEVEFVYCIYAGYSESYNADENTIWPHQWALSWQAGATTVDGVKCDTYACSGELVYNESYESKIGKVLAGIGLICHEFSHCLGLHDIYDTTYESGNWGMDYWDVMDQGNYAAEGYVPVGYSAYQRDFCGWRDLVVLDKKGDYSMKPLTRGGVGYKVVNDANSNEYYILENRKQEEWDSYLFNSGMLVIHVDYDKSAWDNNTINTTKNHPRYTLIPADNKLDVYGDVSSQEFVASLKGDVWPGTSGNTELTNTSVPAAKVYTGGYMNKPIRDIKYENDVISFNFKGGVFDSAPTVLPATDITENSFIANWEALKGADEYSVEVSKLADVEEGTGDLVEIFADDFMGCTKTNTDITSTLDSCTAVRGWTGYKIYSEGGVVRIGSSSNAGWLTTPVINATGTVTVSFSTKLYNSNDTGSKLTVSIVGTDNTVIKSEEYTPIASVESKEITADVDGGFCIKFCTDKSTGKKRAYVDDLIVSAASSVSSEVVASVVTSETSHKFEGLKKGCNYRYRVQARDEYGSSDFSVYESLPYATSIGDVVAENGSVEIYTLSGVKIYSGSADAAPALANGVYIIKSGTVVKKIAVK
ncbi:MAG: M6 family metalloprotease domain-containing protein [Bacteroidaceae bacterium]|nr:M6 family metalloprotease domain-containing protein [Bacteroidaceae bacterium]